MNDETPAETARLDQDRALADEMLGYVIPGVKALAEGDLEGARTMADTWIDPWIAGLSRADLEGLAKQLAADCAGLFLTGESR